MKKAEWELGVRPHPELISTLLFTLPALSHLWIWHQAYQDRFLEDWCFNGTGVQAQHLGHFFFIQFHNFIEFGIHYTKYLVATYLSVISKES